MEGGSDDDLNILDMAEVLPADPALDQQAKKEEEKVENGGSRDKPTELKVGGGLFINSLVICKNE